MGPRSPTAVVAVVLVAAGALSGGTSRARAQEADPSSGVRVDGVAAVIGAYSGGQDVDLILRSDVDLVARIALAGAPESGSSAGTVELPAGLLGAAFDRLLGEVLIAREAERVRIQPPGEAQVTAEVERIRTEAGGAARLAAILSETDTAPAEIEAIARRRALVAAFLEANLEGTTAITDAEVEATYEAGEHPFIELPLEQARTPLRAWLAQSAVMRAVRRWVGVLRARVPSQILVDYGE